MVLRFFVKNNPLFRIMDPLKPKSPIPHASPQKTQNSNITSPIQASQPGGICSTPPAAG